MKKKEIRNGNKTVSVLCLIAIAAMIFCQFLPCWSYTGIAKNIELGEERVKTMSSSVASYCWLPDSVESDAFEEYVKAPTKIYTEEVEVVEYSEEEIADIKKTVENMGNEEATEEVVEETETAEVAETTEEATEEATEETAEEVVEEEADEVVLDEGEVVTIEGMLVTIKEYEKEPGDVTEADKIVPEKFKGLSDAEFVNKLTTIPAFSMAFIILAIAIILLKFKKIYLPAVAVTFVGAFHLYMFAAEPIFLLSDKRMFFLIVAGIVTALGAILVFYDFRVGMKLKKAEKAAMDLEGAIEG